eukprot:gene5431-6775_t
MKFNIIILYLFLFNLLLNYSNADLDPAEIQFLNDVKAAFNLPNWNISDPTRLCTRTYGWSCNTEKTNILFINIFTQDNSGGDLPLSIANCKKLGFFGLAKNMFIPDAFWSNMPPILSSISCDGACIASQPVNWGSTFPTTFISLTVESLNFPVPLSLFNTKLQTLFVKANSPQFSFPQITTDNTEIRSLQFPITGENLPIGLEKFKNLNTLSIMKFGPTSFTYNSFDQLSTLFTLNIFFVEAPTNASPFPTSLFIKSNLASLYVEGDGYFAQDGVIQISNYVIPTILANSFVYPSFSKNPQILSMLYSNLTSIDIFDYLKYVQLDVAHNLIKSVLPSNENWAGSPLNFLKLDNNKMSGPIPQHLCFIRSGSVYLNNNNFNGSVPSCFLCEVNRWKSQLLPNNWDNFDDSTLYINCPNFNIINKNFTGVSTEGATIFVEGTDLGWDTNNPINTQPSLSPAIPNKKFSIYIKPGVGANYPLTYSFHASQTNEFKNINFTYSYVTPVLNNFGFVSDVLVFNGNNFGTNASLVSIKVAGQPLEIQKLTQSTITIKSNPFTLPLNEYAFNAEINVGGQVVVKQFISLKGDPVLNKPYQNGYSDQGRVVEFTGLHLTSDKTLMKLMIGSQECQIQQSSLTYIKCYIGPGSGTQTVKLTIGTNYVFTDPDSFTFVDSQTSTTTGGGSPSTTTGSPSSTTDGGGSPSTTTGGPSTTSTTTGGGSPSSTTTTGGNRPISLPHQSSPIKHFALDIGGTLAKLVYFVQNSRSSDDPKSEIGGKLHFIKFQTKNIEDCFDFILENNLHIDEGKPKVVRVTGGGAYKYADLFEKKLGCKLIKEDEMQCLIWGTNFLLNRIQRESFTYSPIPNSQSPKEFIDKVDNPYPYLLVQIGSGVSVLKVDSETSFQRVDGTSLGGGTFWGLCSLLTGVTDFDEMLELTKHGQSNMVDLVVGDIYGTDYTKVGLASDTIASSFGKIIYKHSESVPPFKKEDIAQSLLKMVSNNIGQIAYLNSQRYGLNKIYFGGFFIRDHPNTMQRISFAIDFWSKGKTKAMFLVHDGYLGALGAFLAPGENEEKPNGLSESPADSWWRRTTHQIQKLLYGTSASTTTTTTNTKSLNNHNHNEDKEYECDCGCEFCEGLVCKVDLKSN